MVRRAAAVYRNAEIARRVQRRLVREGVAPHRIDVRQASGARGSVSVVRSSMPEGLALGALLGSSAGAAVALSALFVPDLALGLSSLGMGTLAGGLVGAFVGALSGRFCSEPQRRLYSELLMKRGVIVSVESTDQLQLKVAKQVFVGTRGVLLHVPPEAGLRSSAAAVR